MRTLVAMGCVVLTLTASTAHASLISMNDAFYGPNSITLDTNTDFQWLDLTLSTDFSVNQIQAGQGGFLAQGFQLATLSQVEAMYTSGGWDGVDDSANNGSVGHLAFVQSMLSLFGSTGTNFNEGWALTAVSNEVSRPFNAITQSGTAGRVACTTAGFNAFPSPVNSFNSCRMDYDQHYPYIGAYLLRPEAPTPVPEPATLLLLGSGLSAAALRRRMKKRA